LLPHYHLDFFHFSSLATPSSFGDPDGARKHCIMTATRSGQTTGADLDRELRRRNVPAQEGSNGTISKSPEAEDNKKARKVFCPLLNHDRVLTRKLQPQSSILQILDDYEFLIAPLIFTALAFFTRMWKIGLSPIVTWDEAQYVNYPASVRPSTLSGIPTDSPWSTALANLDHIT